MWCLVAQPNSVIVEVDVSTKAKGQEVLEKACQVLGIRAESDYFGLRYTSVKGQELWLNLRNPLERQVPTSAQMVRFMLRVKFWVPPHLVLQDTTRHQMFLQVRLELESGKLVGESTESKLKLGSLLVQAESGDQSPLNTTALHGLCHHWSNVLTGTEESAQDIAHLHSQLHGMKASTAEYWVLNEVSTLNNFGEEIFQFKDTKLGIGPHGINIYQPLPNTIPYSAIRSASSLRRLFQLWYLDPDHKEELLEVKCDSCIAASGLYRALTEKHAFYSCDTVRGAVTAQYIRDLKGTIVSIFNESSGLGKKYVFDIRRTCREVHDNARRALYEAGAEQTEPQVGDGPTSSGAPWPDVPNSPNDAREILHRLYDALTCRICMDVDIDTVLFPCKHMVCCSDCAGRCASCPLCRAPIESATRVYHPTSEIRAGLSNRLQAAPEPNS